MNSRCQASIGSIRCEQYADHNGNHRSTGVEWNQPVLQAGTTVYILTHEHGPHVSHNDYVIAVANSEAAAERIAAEYEAERTKEGKVRFNEDRGDFWDYDILTEVHEVRT